MKHSRPTRALTALCLLVALTGSVGCAPRAPAPEPAIRSYVFAWPYIDSASLGLRGGTTRGAPVTLAAVPSAPWTALRREDRSAFEHDRAAILAMAGDFRTSFDFLETVVFAPPYEPAQPYRSWATERIYVAEDRGDFIALQHILVMFVIDEDGQRQGPFVQKHWRQDWHYEPHTVLEYMGRRQWRQRVLDEKTRRGLWSQSVYQVDDTPRYASTGHWQHQPSFSSWTGNRTARPLPRREHAVRQDYDLLVGRNRHTIVPGGWVHEQDNLKQLIDDVSTSPDASDATPTTKAREIGVNRYERIRDFDFTAGDAYWRATGPLWAEVRRAWAKKTATPKTLSIAASCDNMPVFISFFEYAQRFEQGEAPTPDATQAFVDQLLDCIVN